MTSIPLIALLPFLSTFLGGYVVLRWKRDLHPWLSLSAGVLLGVAFLDLLPEAFAQAATNHIAITTVCAMSLGAIIFFHILDDLFGSHHHEHVDGEPEESCENTHHRKTATWIRAFGMVFHSLLDGLAIGGGFAASYQLGLLITTAVVMHDFSDGMSTVTILRHGVGKDHRGIIPILALDAVAPIIGAVIGSRFAPSTGTISLLLAVFAGFFIFLSLSELLPQAHANAKRRYGFVLTILGILAIAFIQTFAKV